MGLYRVTVSGTMAGHAVNNIFGWKAKAGDFDSEAEALVAAVDVRTSFVTNILPRLTTVYQMQGVEARALGAEPYVASASASATGAQFGSPLPSFVCVKAVFRTATPGRAGTGRTGFAGINESDTDSANPNVIASGTLATWETAIDEFVSDIAAGDGNLAVISTRINNAERPDPLASVVTSASIRADVGSRLSRLR